MSPEELPALYLDFTVSTEEFGRVVVKDLKPGGGEIDVTAENRWVLRRVSSEIVVASQISDQPILMFCIVPVSCDSPFAPNIRTNIKAITNKIHQSPPK